ncbi:MAG: hypothetical protein ASARMPRED_008577 [Alectoria sarmentosa]|nr:MAG: hypothetical protein ASARMPRED_008577 [Alectoria sarmentosa]
MPRTSLPPTPAASTEILGKDASPATATDKSFNLPPPAIESHRSNGASTAHKQPLSASSPAFSLPPPPTRSRTIIQMKPKPQSSADLSSTPVQQGSKGSNKKTSASSITTATTGKKQPSSTSVAGKKIARKTAHSVIERRRRSKMNEEFGTLKAMIPACTDQEMHKLAILQASIDYLRYLEKCITDLKDANNSLSIPLVQAQALPSRFDAHTSKQNDEEEDEDDDDEDVTMADPDSNGTSPSVMAIAGRAYAYTSPQSITVSPAIAIEDQSQYQHSSYASSISTLPSPAFEPQNSGYRGSQSHFSLSASTSPTIMPSREQDQEATAALLMLNKDRRNPKGGRAMSVRDLLTMVSDQDKGWNHRYYDSYRPFTKREASSENRSPTITAESEAFRYHSNKHWYRAKSFRNSTPQGDASSTLNSSCGQPQDHSSPAACVPDETPPTTGHDLQQLASMASQGRKGTTIPDAALSRRLSRAVDAEEETHESEAQSRGFYASSRSRTSNAVHVGRYELKRRQGDEETERSPKRSRGEEDDGDRPANRPRNAEEDEPVRLHCKNYKCMESLEHAHGENSLPKRPEKIVLPNHGLVKDSEGPRLRASRNVFDPNFEDTRRVPQQSGPIVKGASSPTDRPLQGLREPKRSSSPRSRTTSTSQQLTVSTQAPSRLATSPSTQPSISPLDPRLRRGPALTPLVSPLHSLKMSLEPGEIPSVGTQMLGEPPSNPSQHRPLEVGATPSRASVQHEQYPSQTCGRREAYVPSTSSWKEDRHPRAPDQKHQTASQDPTRNEGPVLPASTLDERSANDHLDTLEARLKAFEEEEGVKQKEHEKELARKARRQKMEYEHELEEMINQKKHDADMARKAAVMKQAEEHERRLAELRRR